MTSRRTPRVLLASLLVLPLGLAACGGGSDDGGTVASEPGAVDVVDNAFKPKSIDIAVGDTVTWTFKGSAQHNVHSSSGFASENMKKGTYEHTFNSAGTVKYQCTIHPGMTGEIKVS
jgi:plastocyanin